MAEEKDIHEEEVSKENGKSEGTAGEAEAQSGKEATAEEKYAELNDRFLRLYAEFENFRRRTNKEKLDLINSASSGVLKDMLPVLDDFERAIQNNDKVEDVQAMREGFLLIYNKFKHVLEAKGLKPMQSKGEAFDSELHEAVANIPAPEDELKGKVIEDVEKGYYLNDKVIRFAKVVVGN